MTAATAATAATSTESIGVGAPLARSLREAVGRFALAFDAALVTVADADAVVREMAAIESMAAVVKAKAAARSAASDAWRREGDRSAAHRLARTTGTTVSAAQDALATAKRLDDLPATDEAARRGDLSREQVTAVAEASSVNPAAESQLLAAAQRKSVAELRDDCARAKAAADPDPEARRRRVHASRSCTRRSVPDGAEEIRYRSTPDEVAAIWAVLQGYARTAFDEARVAGRRERRDAYQADALLAMARAAGLMAQGGSPAAGSPSPAPGESSGTAGDAPRPSRRRVRKPVPTKVIVRIDHAALVRGRAIGGETCEIAGVGPVPVSVVEDILEREDPFLAAVVTRGHDVLTVAHLKRKANVHQQTALEWMGVECSRLGCHSTEGLQIDHVEDWADTHRTALPQLRFLCAFDHRLKTTRGWMLVPGPGKQPMVPPSDPRHPRRARGEEGSR
jgi:hypothetical protein